MEDTVGNMNDLLEERKKFRELMNEILSMIRPKSTRPVVDNVSSTDKDKNPETNENVEDRRELLRILKNIYESCCNSVAIDHLYSCDKVNCRNDLCAENEEIGKTADDNLSILNFDEFMSAKTNNEHQNFQPEEHKNICQSSECKKPISVIIYTHERSFNNRRRRRKRLESRNCLKNTPIRITQHFISSPT